jgi:hypothetical protein
MFNIIFNEIEINKWTLPISADEPFIFDKNISVTIVA